MSHPWCIRVPTEDEQKFRDRCAELDVKPTDMIRELIEAFAEGRVTIIPSEAQLQQRREIYHESGN